MKQTQRGSYDAFDRGSGNGSSSAEDDMVEKYSIFHNEWGSAAATTFNPSDTDSKGNSIPKQKRQKFEDLYALHNGKGEQSRKDDIRWSHIKNDAKTFMSVLELPSPQRKQVMYILEEIDISTFGSDRTYEKIILGICSLVSDKELSERYDETETTKLWSRRLYNREEYQDLMEAVSMSVTEYRRVREQVRQKSDCF
jgi:hypothetical protein